MGGTYKPVMEFGQEHFSSTTGLGLRPRDRKELGSNCVGDDGADS